MNKGLALFFAVGGTVLLASISFFIAAGRPWMVLLSAAVSTLFIGAGFITKARLRKRKE